MSILVLIPTYKKTIDDMCKDAYNYVKKEEGNDE